MTGQQKRIAVINGEEEYFTTKHDVNSAYRLYNKVIAKSRVLLEVDLGLLDLGRCERKLLEENDEKSRERLKRLGIDNAEECYLQVVEHLKRAKHFLNEYTKNSHKTTLKECQS